jgi:hypothetical protein
MSDTTSTYESDKKYQSLKKKVTQLFEKRKTLYAIELNYGRFTATFMEKHATTDDTRCYANDLLAHLKIHVYDVSMAERNAKEIEDVRTKAAEHVKAALESIVQEDTCANRIKESGVKRRAITDEFIKQKNALEKEYAKTLKAVDAEFDIEMLIRAQQEVNSKQRKLGGYSYSLTQIEKEEYSKAVETELASESKSNKKRVQIILV